MFELLGDDSSHSSTWNAQGWALVEEDGKLCVWWRGESIPWDPDLTF